MAGSGSNPKSDKDPHSGSPSPSEEESRPPHRILVVEDDKNDVLMIREALQGATLSSAEIDVADDGDKAVRYLQRLETDETAACPSIVLLDLNLPKLNGAEVLTQMRKMHRCGNLPVIVVTTSNSTADRQMVARLGVSEYFRKPSDYDEFMKLGGIVKKLLSTKPQ